MAGQQFATIGAAVAASRDGDALQVQARTYTNDFATSDNKITLEGVGGHMIDHFEFSGAQRASGKAAGMVSNASGSPTTIPGNKVYGLSDAQLVSGGGTATGAAHLATEPA